MRKVIINGNEFVLPKEEEWIELINGHITEIEGISVLSNKLIKGVIEYALRREELNTSKTLGALEIRTFRNNTLWFPSILYFPSGYPIDIDKNTEDFDRIYFRVYFSKFHCFDCKIDIDGYALDREFYIFNNEELKDIYKSYDFFKLKCPKCNGSMRSPGLVEIKKIYD